ncbi:MULTISPECIES: DciA family protein [unclassified Streptomyces]|uniref:DciA family protein n=1 Tax=unclassified Streptomyces TaxID=2593676 RepID=UPI000882CD8E|nr:MULTISPECIES: DciA family protein [unclassified Streptomyces]PBC72338.1 uncharacterized protein DUF721 [Streptomyces sp. 2321.6]SDR62122.1 Protein of unknown function [Streptomyces sp. KS_16]SEE50410.1 Protein of unknown function [Streptomyces sp. 2133.1]SNC77842.1 Protein of unknown function [Streptomyces sp. 2114.4]
MTEPQPSGKDICREALAAYKNRSWAIPGNDPTKRKSKTVRARPGDGRDPVGLGNVIKRIEAEQDWKTGMAGGNIVDQWHTLCPELVGKVQPVSLDATGCLTVQPTSPAYAAHLRILGAQLVGRLQAKGVPVRSIRPLRPGHIAAPSDPAAEDRTERPAEPAPEKTRAQASPGYRAALAAHQAHAADRTETDIQQRARAAADRQTAAMRAHREDPEGHRDAAWFVNDLEEKAAAEREQTRQAAIRRARGERAGLAPEVRTAFQRTA